MLSRRPRRARSAEVGSVEDEEIARDYEPIANIRERAHVEVAELADVLERELDRGYRIVEIVAAGRVSRIPFARNGTTCCCGPSPLYDVCILVTFLN